MSWKCKFCGKETDDYYMLNDHMWWKINLSDEEYKQMLTIHPLGDNGEYHVFDPKTPDEIQEKLDGCACLDCVRKRLGRDFEITDFPINLPINIKNDFIFNEVYPKFINKEGYDQLKENRDVIFQFASFVNMLENVRGNICMNEITGNLDIGKCSIFDFGTKLFEYRKKHL